ncbi:DegT/DnrJ/EryC1/StrS aminotransferase family protein [Daejeonella sp.]|uniref:DegT/DnrJ/EryC1/StrS family aminotransferase n=1 Tax=Daejeonella sp. TaxID=2805397 RepID=UPI002730FF20|nr:DegT/DnrJ/EryC1/StrS family aminotransferase [Daejeonella sp.]MDP2414322.1 DegT/DnrJ/EryC1/StrS family aminotransferase [Daejeonella sp.]
MPGFELIDQLERNSVLEVFDKSNGVLFAHGFDVRRNNIFRVRDFEIKFAKALGGRKAAACTSGTSAQYIAMKCLGIKAGDEVITQAFTFIATVEAILACGAKPVLVDIDETYNMSPRSLEEAITDKTKLIVPVHMLGNPAEMDAINAIAKKHNIPVLEDACEALGATYKGVSTGLLSDIGIFSLDFGKTITTGEGGMIISNNENLITTCMKFIDHGHDCDMTLPRGKDTASFYGFNYRMSELQAAVGLIQVERLTHIVESNRNHKKIIKNELSNFTDKIKFRRITDENELADTIIFNLESPKLAEKLIGNLAAQGLGTKNVPDAMRWHFAKYFSQVWNNTSYYKNYENQWSVSDSLLSRSVSLPVMVNWSEKDLEKITASISTAISLL